MLCDSATETEEEKQGGAAATVGRGAGRASLRGGPGGAVREDVDEALQEPHSLASFVGVTWLSLCRFSRGCRTRP